MANLSPALMSNRDLLDATVRALDRERRTTADLLALLAELDTRKLYLGEGYASLFTYCTGALHLSEPAAYSRITAARAARRYPVIFDRLAEGTVTLTTIGLLAAHLTDEHHEALLDAARHKSKRDVERLVASLYPQPDISSSVRRLVTPAHVNGRELPAIEAASPAEAPIAAPTVVRAEPPTELPTEPPTAAPTIAPTESTIAAASSPECAQVSSGVTPLSRRSLLAPLSSERYLLKVTLSRDADDKLERARALLRHSIPNGDPAAVVERALTALVEQLEKRKIAATSRPRRLASLSSRTRHVPADVRRAVWAREGGRCAFVGALGRCAETAFLEFHHVRPFAVGGATDVDNLQLRCRAHNAHEAVRYFGEAPVGRKASTETLSGADAGSSRDGEPRRCCRGRGRPTKPRA
jgi:5-methylcytosine-specific restriction endonuclease McrA